MKEQPRKLEGTWTNLTRTQHKSETCFWVLETNRDYLQQKRASKHKNFFWNATKKWAYHPYWYTTSFHPIELTDIRHMGFSTQTVQWEVFLYMLFFFFVFPSVIVIGQWDQTLTCVHQRKTTINLCSGHRLNQSQSGTALPEGKQTCTFWYLNILILLFQVAAQST